MDDQWFHKIFSVTGNNFEDLALDVFRFQSQHNAVYKDYLAALKFNPGKLPELSEVPFLPVQFFKTMEIKTTDFAAEACFESSGTSRTGNSRHLVKNIQWYRESFIKGFERVYGAVNEWCVLGLLPSYLERKTSSLVFMVDELIRKSGHPESGFYLYDHEKLYMTLKRVEAEQQKTLLIGVGFALLDFAENYSMPLQHTVIMETGGMKGRRKEMVRQELHHFLKTRFGLADIHSEYGMTELLSQAYSRGDGIFHCPPWMKIFVRDEEDPMQVHTPTTRSGSLQATPSRGVINIIDLANIYSCSFIATDDAGVLHGDESFEVVGRIDNADIRGCSLLVL